MENFNKYKDWLLGGLLVFISGMAVDIRNKVYDLDKKSVLIEYRITQLEKTDKIPKSSNETAYLQIGDFIMPTKIEIANKDEDGNEN